MPAVPADGTIPNDKWFPTERLLSHKKVVGKKVFYLVKWLDSAGSRAWIHEENVTQYAIDRHYVENRSKSRRRQKRRG